jgi:hypothetical protein
MASNEHAGLLEGRESHYPKLRQYLRSIYMGWITESEKFTPPELIPQRWTHESLCGWKEELEFSTSHDIKGYPRYRRGSDGEALSPVFVQLERGGSKE